MGGNRAIFRTDSTEAVHAIRSQEKFWNTAGAVRDKIRKEFNFCQCNPTDSDRPYLIRSGTLLEIFDDLPDFWSAPYRHWSEGWCRHSRSARLIVPAFLSLLLLLFSIISCFLEIKKGKKALNFEG
ncbi:hypothetical protein ACS0TY_025465 [Phlomoides rotata]